MKAVEEQNPKNRKQKNSTKKKQLSAKQALAYKRSKELSI